MNDDTLAPGGFNQDEQRQFYETMVERNPEAALDLQHLVSDDMQRLQDRRRRAEDMLPDTLSRGQVYTPPESFKSQQDVDDLLAYVHDKETADLKFGDGEPLTMRVQGTIYRLTHRALTNDEVRTVMSVLYHSSSIVTSVLGGERRDFAYTCRQGAKMGSRWRVCVTLRGSYDGIGFRIVMRRITIDPPTVAEVYLQDDIVDSVMKLDRGLILVTGPTGSGKSTSLAALLRHRLQSPLHSDHLITIESPIEYLHSEYPRPFSEVTQWEVPRMLSSFSYAVETALRCDPDLVLVGEMRDKATMKAAIEISLTGHGGLSTLHTSTAVQTVTRILQAFTPEEIPAVQYDLVDNLSMIVSQLLRQGPDGRRVALRERLIFDGQIKDRLRSAKNLSHELRKVMESHGRLMVDEAREVFKDGRLAKAELDRIEFMDSKERAAFQ